MVNYNWKHPEKLYFDVIEYFDGKINSFLTTYICASCKDDQNKIKQYLEEKNEFSFSNIHINILMNIEFQGENKWLLTSGYCESLEIFFPLALFIKEQILDNDNDNEYEEYDNQKDILESFDCINENVLEKIRDFLFWNKNSRKICNSCEKDAVYNCKECDNVDFCEECQQTSRYEKLHMKKLLDSEKKGICDVCGKKQPDYSNKNYYYLCADCFIDNPHRNHQLTKLEKKSNLFNDDEMIKILKKTLYYYFAVQILQRCNSNKSQKWKILEKDNICQIFNCEHPVIVAYIELQKIKEDILEELKKIELEFSELFDKMIRKFFVYDIRQFDFIFRGANNIVVFGSDKNCVDFYNNSIIMIKNKITLKEINKELKFDDIIEL
jgi:hypothetical protein